MTDLQRHRCWQPVKQKIATKWRRTKEDYRDTSGAPLVVYYFSIEFCQVASACEPLTWVASRYRQMMAELDVDFNAVMEAEVDQGLGNGGLATIGF